MYSSLEIFDHNIITLYKVDINMIRKFYGIYNEEETLPAAYDLTEDLKSIGFRAKKDNASFLDNNYDSDED